MKQPDVPEDLEAFIRDHIRSAEELEALLLLYRTTARWWTIDEVTRALHLDSGSARRALERLSGAFLEVRIDADLCFRFATLNAERARLTARLDGAYHRDRTALMQLAGRGGAARDFADAFRLKKEEP
jgi:hypothetical protein